MTPLINFLAIFAKQHWSMAMYLPAVLTLPFTHVSLVLTLLAFAITTHHTSVQFVAAQPTSKWSYWREKWLAFWYSIPSVR